jgi:hypothetical protein
VQAKPAQKTPSFSVGRPQKKELHFEICASIVKNTGT